jgi:hypothetical protein
MSESEKHLLEVVNKLAERFDSYDKRITVLSYDVSKVQSEVDLSMRSIQALQKEQIMLVKLFNNSGAAGLPGSLSSNGVMGVSPGTIPSSAPAPPPPHLSH